MASNQVAAHGRVLKAATVQLRRTDPLSLTVAERVANAQQEAYGAGFDEGFTAGALRAGAELIELGERLRASISEELAQHARQVRDNRTADAERLAELALAVAEWVVRRELSSVPDAFFGKLTEMLAARGRHDHVEIETSPALVQQTRRWLADPDISVVGAEDLEDGEARVALGDTTVFATFTDAFERARAVLDAFEQTQPFTGDPVTEHDPDEIVEVLYDVSNGGSR